ncbi:MAG: CoA-binding protein [Flavobacteriales bacterium]|nr:CoA-binding protein [Flavobacteriales bacterium]
MNQGKTLVLGASPNPERYSYRATTLLQRNEIPVVPLGIRDGVIGGQSIELGKPQVDDVETITLYVGPARQPEYYDYLLDLNPKRIIFNPGTENPELIHLAAGRGIETEVACTLVLLSTGQY